MKIDSPAFKALFSPELNKLSTLFKKNGYELRIAGGAVRDLLMHITPADIDFATTATPTEMISLFEREQVRMLHKKGEEHGTVTCRIEESNFEITTLRVDVVCDGRRAEVQFTTDWETDANRRDLTINSLFLDLDGTVVDFTGGVEDVQKRRIAFVGDPVTRIQEDYLRILRYFRFFGRIANDGASHEEKTIEAVRENKKGLEGVSAERIWTELKRIVIGRMAPDVVRVMIEECELTSLIGMPSCSSDNLQRFTRIFEFAKKAEKNDKIKLESMTMVAALCNTADDIAAFHAKTKLSNAERELGEFIVEQREAARKEVEGGGDSDSSRTFWRHLIGRQLGAGKLQDVDAARLRGRVVQLALSVGASDQVLEDILSFTPPAFPVTGNDLMNAAIKAGPKMQATKMYLFDRWIESSFSLSKEALLERAHDAEIPSPPSPKRVGKRKRTPTGGDKA